MTTSVIVNAGHGWPVDLVFKDPKTGDILSTQRVAADTNQTIYIHRGADVLIHEVQPEELAAESYDDEASAAADFADAQKVSAITGAPIPDPLIDQVVKIDPETNQIIAETPVAAAPDQAAVDAADAAAKQAQADAQAAADAAAAQAKIDADAAQKVIDDQAAADAAAAAQKQAEDDAAAAQKAIDDQAAIDAQAASDADAAAAAAVPADAVVPEVTEVQGAGPVADGAPIADSAPVETPVADAISDPEFGTDPVDDEAPKLDQQS